MINILVPLSGENTFKTSSEKNYPRILSDIDGKILLERAAKPFLDIALDKSITVALPQPESERYNLKEVFERLGSDVSTCSINGKTQGAACSALLAIENLDLESPLIITSFEQVLDLDLNPIIQKLLNENVDAGVLTFNSIHPKWSYVKTNQDGYAVQAEEKRPISNKAIAGFYYFKSVNLFFESAKNMIRNDVKTNGEFYVAPVLNEVILNEGIVKVIEIDKGSYFHISNENEFKNYEKNVITNKKTFCEKVLTETKKYIDCFNTKNALIVTGFFSDIGCLVDPNGRFVGRNQLLNYLNTIFESCNELEFTPTNISVINDDSSLIEFVLNIDEKQFVGVDIIRFNKDYKIDNLTAYLYEKV